MEKMEHEGSEPQPTSVRKQLRNYKVLNIVLIVLLVCCIVVIVVAIPLLAMKDDGEDEDTTVSSTIDTIEGSTKPQTNITPSTTPPVRPTTSPTDDCVCTSDLGVQDVVIVGGGPGGTYMAYRLKKNITMDGTKVLLLEANDRIGGRLHSVPVPGFMSNIAEVGGMRYIPLSQPLVEQVIQELAIPFKTFEMDEENENRPYLLRDFFVQQGNLTKVKLPYRLKDDELHMLPDALQKKYFYATVPPSERGKPLDQAYTVYGDPLYYYGQANVFSLANASADAQHYFQDGNGYTYLFPQNPGVAGNLLGVTNDTSMTTGYRTPVQGMQQIPIALWNDYTTNTGNNSRYMLNSTVTAIRKCSLGGQPHYSLTTADSVSGKMTYYCGKKVVLSLTRSQLKRIDWEPLRSSPKAHLVDAVASHKSTKFFLLFSEPWWKKPELEYLKLSKGRSISSLQTRQTFYFSPPTVNATSSNSLIMAYNDGPNAEFWGSLTDRKFSKFVNDVPLDFVYQMNDVLVKEAVRQIALNHNTTEDVIGQPIQGLVMFWNHDTTPSVIPGYGPNMPSEAWHMWKAGVNISEAMKEITQLDPLQEVYIVGSAYSNNQGWTEGAFQSVEDLLHGKFSQERRFANVLRVRSPIYP